MFELKRKYIVFYCEWQVWHIFSSSSRLHKGSAHFPSDWAESPQAAAITHYTFWMDHDWFLFWIQSIFPYMVYDKSQIGLTTELSGAFALVDLLQIKLVFCVCACVVSVCPCVCVCMEALIRGLERYSEGPCPPLLCSLLLSILASRLSSLLSVSIRFSSARLLHSPLSSLPCQH